MTNLGLFGAAALAAGLFASPSLAAGDSVPMGAAQGYYNDEGSLQPVFPEHLASAAGTRTRALVPDVPDIAMPPPAMRDAAGQGGRSPFPGPGRYYDQGGYEPAWPGE